MLSDIRLAGCCDHSRLPEYHGCTKFRFS